MYFPVVNLKLLPLKAHFFFMHAGRCGDIPNVTRTEQYCLFDQSKSNFYFF